MSIFLTSYCLVKANNCSGIFPIPANLFFCLEGGVSEEGTPELEGGKGRIGAIIVNEICGAFRSSITYETGISAPTSLVLTKTNTCPFIMTNLTTVMASNSSASTRLTWHTVQNYYCGLLGARTTTTGNV